LASAFSSVYYKTDEGQKSP